MTIDTLAYAKHLEEAGVERRQAEAFAEALNRFAMPDLSTKADIAALGRATKSDIAALEQATKSDIAALKHELVAMMHTIEIRSLGIIAAMLGLAVTIIKWV